MYYYIYDSFVKKDKAAMKVLNLVNERLTELDMLGEVAEVSLDRPMKKVIDEGVMKGHTTIIAIGNDQTLNEATLALVGNKNVALGLIPVGTGNALAQTLGLTNPDEIAEILASRKCEELDVGVVNNRIFIGSLEIGVPTDMQSSRAAKSQQSILRKVSDAGKILISGNKGASITIACKVNGQYKLTAITPHCAFVNIHTGAEKQSRIRSNDAELDLVIADDMQKTTLYKHLPNLRIGNYEAVPHTTYLRGYKFQITSSPHVPIWADGAEVATTPATIGIIPKGIRVIVGKDRAIA